MTPMVQGAFAFSTEALTQRWSWGRVMSRRSGGTWQRRWPRARKPGPAEAHGDPPLPDLLDHGPNSGVGIKHIVRYAFRKGSQRAYFDRASLTCASAFSRRAMSVFGRICVSVQPLAEEMTKRRPGPLLTVSVATSFDTSLIDPTTVQAADAVAAAALCTRSIRDFQSAAPRATAGRATPQQRPADEGDRQGPPRARP